MFLWHLWWYIYIYIFIHSKYDIYNYLRAMRSQNHAKNSHTFISTCNVYKGLQAPITTGLLEAFWGIAAGRGQFLQTDVIYAIKTYEICAFVSGADLLWSFSSSLWICQDSRSNFETPSPGAVTASKHALHILAHFAQTHQTLQKASSSRNQTPTNVSTTDRFVEMVAKDENMLWKDVTEWTALFPIPAEPDAPAVQTSG